jgi:phosphate transport system protein
MEQLDKDMIAMGDMVIDNLSTAVSALVNHDPALAKKAIELDETVNKRYLEIETEAIESIALQNPIAKDLRIISSVIKIISDIERIGDHATDIAKISQHIINMNIQDELKDDIVSLSEVIKEIFKDAISSYVNRDEELARSVCTRDDEVDRTFKILFDEFMQSMILNPNEENIKVIAQLLFVIRYMERIGDHINNIAERVVYMQTGQLMDLNT